MAKYWVYLNDQVVGPFDVEQLVRLRGFSRQTQVCEDDHSGKPGTWMSTTEIPELAHIFKAAGEWSESPSPAGAPTGKSMAPRPVSAKPPSARPAVAVRPPAAAPGKRSSGPGAGKWILILTAILAAVAGAWYRHAQVQNQRRERALAFSMVETSPFPAGSQYAHLRDYLEKEDRQHRWDADRNPSGLWNVSLSVYGHGAGGSGAVAVYAFEVNLQAQTVRALNSAAARLMSEGFRAPAAPPASPAAAKPRKSPAERFVERLDAVHKAYEQGDFGAVWDSFSARRHSDMLRAGISREGFMRVQTLTRGPATGWHQSLVKTKQEGDRRMLVLWRQTQPKRPDMFAKQTWVFEQGEWKLDEEDKRLVQPPAASSSTASSQPSVLSLPGLSN